MQFKGENMVFCRGCFMPIMNNKMYIYDDAGYCENCILKKLLTDEKIILIENMQCSQCKKSNSYGYLYNGKEYCKEHMIEALLNDKIITLEEV